MSEETIDLTEILHRGTDELPVFVRGAAGLRRAAERGRRRRRVVVACSASVAVLLGAVALLSGPGQNSVSPPPPAETPTPTDHAGDLGLLGPDDLPSGVPFGRWTGYIDSTDPAAGPFCVPEFTTAGATQWQLRTFRTDTAGVDGYQAIVRFGSQDAASHASSTMTDLAICGPPSKSNFAFGSGRNGGRGQDGEGVAPGDPIISLAWQQSKDYVSVVWLSWRSAVLLTDPVMDTLWETIRTRLTRATADQSPPKPTIAELAMLAPSDLLQEGAAPGSADPVKNVYADPYTYWPLHTCDSNVAGTQLRELILGQDRLGVIAGQRLAQAADEASAKQVFEQLRAQIQTCAAHGAVNDGIQIQGAGPVAVPAIGDDTAGWQYNRRWPDGRQDHVYVAILRIRSLVTQVVRVLHEGEQPAPTIAALLTVAGERLAAKADQLARVGIQPGPAE